jgi:DNA repair exonuclease SbcCD nuclease subunit
VKVLCTGDIHIGRRSSRLPAGVEVRTLASSSAWTRIVEAALAERVDLVAISGDVVDRANRFYEAAGPLELGLRRLEQAGIAVVMVAGNHDHDVLPWLVEGLGPGVRLLGRGGVWERLTLERGGRALHIDGWSFPEARVETSPLAGYAPPPPDGAPVLGLLHADLDQPGSPYAPVALAELRARAASLWLLGHVHAPRSIEGTGGGAAVLYPGSPQAMDPGETGVHGAWIADFGAGSGAPRLRHLPLSTVRYDTVEVDIDGTGEVAEVDRRVVDAVRAHLEAVAPVAGPLAHLCCRLRVVGRTPLHRALEARLDALCADLELLRDGVTARVESIELRTRPARDLVRLAQGSDAPAVLARLVAALDGGAVNDPDGDHAALLHEARRLDVGIRRARPYLQLHRDASAAPDDAEDDELAERLREQAVLLLDELLAQKEEVEG